MNISIRWLSDFVEGDLGSLEELTERLALSGFPVEGIQDFRQGLSDIVVGRVLEAQPHPDADRLKLCRVDAGTGEELQVICGAPNARSGGIYPFIPVGGVLPDGMKIRKAKIRGTHSFGMLCSAREMGLGQEHDGILELSGEYAPGTPFLEAVGLDDAILDVEVTANRGDLLSHIGVAREVGSVREGLPSLPGTTPVPFELRSAPDRLEVDGVTFVHEAPEDSRRFLGAIVRGVKVGPSPDWLRLRLRAIGARPINNVVDATNYVLFELGQPTHAYDLAKLHGPEIRVRRARAGEEVTTLDGEARTLTSEMLVIADADRTVDIAGIMGELETSVTEETVDLLLECAHFEPGGVRMTKKALGIQSDAGYRFERFVDAGGQERALARVLEIILATAGGELHPVVGDLHPRPWSDPEIALRLSRVEHLLGVPFEAERIGELLTPLGFEVVGADGDVLTVRVPGWRGADVTREVDLIEEIARRHGYDAFPATLGTFRPGTVPDHPLFHLEDETRRWMAGVGAWEAQTPAFVPAEQGEVELNNPLSTKEPVLRREILPSLLRRVEYNLARGNRDVRLYEFATSFRKGGPDGLPLEEPRLAVAIHGARDPGHWSASTEGFDIWDLKGWLEALAPRLWPGATVEPGSDLGIPVNPHLALVVKNAHGEVVGCGGVVADASVDLPPWAGSVFGIELRLPADPAPAPAIRATPLPTHPASERDLALLVADEVPAASIVSAARDAGGRLLEEAGVFDLYAGEGVPEGHRSLALRFRFQAEDRTLTDEEVEKALDRIVVRLREEFGVEVRGG